MFAGFVDQTPEGYEFTYDPAYLLNPATYPISLTLPKRQEPHRSESLFAFFFGLMAEGNAKLIQCRKLKLDEADHFGRLLKTTHADIIGAVTIKEVLSS